MNRTFVVLVLFVGYNAGVIESSLALKFTDKTTPSSNTDSSQPTIEIDLGKCKSIDEKELFQTGTERENILNERSFIFIKKLYKPLLRNQDYNFNLNKPIKLVNERSNFPLKSIHASSLKLFFIPNTKSNSAFERMYDPPNYKYIDRTVKNKFNYDRFLLRKPAKQEAVSEKETVLSLQFQKNSNDKSKYLQQSTTHRISEEKIRHEKPINMNQYTRYRIDYNNYFQPPNPWHGSANRHNEVKYKKNTMSAEHIPEAGSIDNLSLLDFKDEDVLLDKYIKEALTGLESKEMPTNNDLNVKKM